MKIPCQIFHCLDAALFGVKGLMEIQCKFRLIPLATKENELENLMHLDLFVGVSRSPEVFTIDQQTLVSKRNGENVQNMLLAFVYPVSM
jgi:hypothetical protein